MQAVSTHSRLKAAGTRERKNQDGTFSVSTHSRLKAAGLYLYTGVPGAGSFNTQPPEGGWGYNDKALTNMGGFNTQPPEGGWRLSGGDVGLSGCFNTQPPEGGWVGMISLRVGASVVSTHSRLKAAGD